MLDIYRFFQIRSNNMTPAAGKILVAEPLMQDAKFSRSVIYLVSNSSSGAFGITLNMPTLKTIQDLVTDSPLSKLPVYWGGPVDDNTLFFLHTFGELIPSTYPVEKGVSCGGDWNVVEQMAQNKVLNSSNFRIFAGYAGWTEGQLEEEIANNVWAVSSITPEALFECPCQNLWENAVNSLGPQYNHWLLMPKIPNVN